jgi:hypothetical protein
MQKKLMILIMAAMSAGAVFAQTLLVSPEKLQATGTRLVGPSSQSALVQNNYAYAVTNASYYTVSVPTDDTWLTVSPASGSSTGEFDTITVSYTTTNLTVGNLYTSTITIQQTNGTVQTKTVPVSLSITEDESLGTAIGQASVATDKSGIAIGDRTGRAVAVGVDTIQIGGGTNLLAGTVKVRTYPLLDSSGVIPAARRGATLASTTNNIMTAFDWVGLSNIVMTIRSVTVINGQITSWGAAQVVTNRF